MRCIISAELDPCFNLASEEVLLKRRSHDYFLLYRNRPSIVVGKHQNTLAEINREYVTREEIPVVRRISGGGTVFHDLGNINFAFITSGREGELVDYPRHTRPIIEALGELGLNVSLGKRNELLLGGRKISGTASHVFKNRALHHGTLLFSSTLDNLTSALKVREGIFSDRAVKSVRSEVTNIREHLGDDLGVEDFMQHLLEYILVHMEGAESYQFSVRDLEEINDLKESRFTTWEWNYGYSPRYRFSKALAFDRGAITLRMNVEKGIIRELRIEGDFMGVMDVAGLEQILEGSIHDPETLRLRLKGVQVGDYISGLGNEAFLSGLF